MPTAARVDDRHACPLSIGNVPHADGSLMPPGAPTVLIGGRPAARVGDAAPCSGLPGSIVSGSATVWIEGAAAARAGDATSHGGVIVGGEATVQIG